MAGSFGGSVKLTCESEYRKALQQITSELRVMASQMQIVTATYGKNDTSVEGLTARNKVLNEQIEKQKEKVDTLKQALEKSKTEYGENSNKTLDWQTKLNKAEAELIKMNNEVEENEQAMKESGKATEENADSMEQFSDSTDDAGKSALSLGDIIKANLISEAIIGGIKALSNAVLGMGKSFVGALSDGVKYNSMIEDYAMSFQTMTGSADKANEMMDEIKKTAKETPFEIEGMADTVKQMMAYGIEADKSIEITKLLGDVSQGNMEKMNSLGYAMGQISSAGKLNGQDLRQLINAGFNPLEEISQRTGESMESLKDKMSKGEITYQMVEDSLKAITGEGGRFENAMINASRTFSGQVDMMEEGWTNFKGILSSGVTDILAKTVMPAVNSVLDSGTTLLEAVLGGDQAQIDEAKTQLVDNITTLVQNVSDQLPSLLQTFGTIIENVLPVLEQALPQVLQIALQIVPNIINGILTALPSLIPVVLNIVTTLVDVILQNLPMILQAGIDILLELIKGIAETLPTLIPTIVDAVILIAETIIDNIDLIIDAGIDIIFGLIDGIINALPRLIEKIPVIIDKLVNAITNNLPKIIQAGITLIIKLAEGLIKAIPQLVAQIPQIISSIVKGLLSGLGQLAEVGLNLVKGLWNGISNATGWILDKIKGFGESVLNGIKSFFGIHSPSTLFRDEIGKNLAYGVGLGFEDGMDKVVEEMQDALPTEFETNANMSINNKSILDGMHNSDLSFMRILGDFLSKFEKIYTAPNIVINTNDLNQEKLDLIFRDIDRRFGLSYN